MRTPLLDGVKTAEVQEYKSHPVERIGGIAGGVGGLLLGALAGHKYLGMRPDLIQPAAGIAGGVAGGVGGSILGRILGRTVGRVGVGSQELKRWRDENTIA